MATAAMSDSGTDQTAQRDERLARYRELREAGLRPVDAAREMGVEWYGTGQRYERWYRRAKGLPARDPDARWRPS